MGYSLYTRTKSARLTITTAEGQQILVENMEGDEGFRIEFEAKRSMDQSPGEFSVTVYNLPPDVLGILQAAQIRRVDDLDQLMIGQVLQSTVVTEEDATAAGYLVVELEAGYDGQVSRVFRAIGARVSSRPDSSLITTITTITAQENLAAAGLGLALQTFPAGSTTFELLDYLRGIAGLDSGNLSPALLTSLLGDSRLDSPFHVSGGQALDTLRDILKALSMRWFIDDRELWVCGREGYGIIGSPPPWVQDEIGEPEILLSPPQRADGGRIIAECLLCPRLRPGRLVRLTEGGLGLASQGLSATLDQISRADVPPGLYRLDEINHMGDTGGGDWTSRMTLRAITQPDVQ